MSLINFKNYPDTTTPLNAENLNNNFEYLDEEINSIIESDSSGDDYYVKFSDGTMICLGTWNIGSSTTGGNTTGNLYYVDISLRHSFPTEFVSTPNCDFDVYDTRSDFTGSIWKQKKYNSVTSTGFGDFRLLSATNTTLNLAVTYRAIGRWK